MEDEGWKSEPLDLKARRTSSWIQEINEVTSSVVLVSGVGLILSVGRRFEGGGVLSWAEYMVL